MTTGWGADGVGYRDGRWRSPMLPGDASHHDGPRPAGGERGKLAVISEAKLLTAGETGSGRSRKMVWRTPGRRAKRVFRRQLAG